MRRERGSNLLLFVVCPEALENKCWSQLDELTAETVECATKRVVHAIATICGARPINIFLCHHTVTTRSNSPAFTRAAQCCSLFFLECIEP